MPTTLTPDELKAKVRSHFEDFVNNRKAEVIRTNMTADFYDHDCDLRLPVGPEEQQARGGATLAQASQLRRSIFQGFAEALSQKGQICPGAAARQEFADYYVLELRGPG
jgi:hypothetical protein